MIEAGDLVRFRNSKIRPIGPYARRRRGKSFRGPQKIMRVLAVESHGPGNVRFIEAEDDMGGIQTYAEFDLVVYRTDPNWAKRQEKRRIRRKKVAARDGQRGCVDEIHDFLDELRRDGERAIQEQSHWIPGKVDAPKFHAKPLEEPPPPKFIEVHLVISPPRQ